MLFAEPLSDSDSAMQTCSNGVCLHLTYANVVNDPHCRLVPESSLDGGLPRLHSADDYNLAEFGSERSTREMKKKYAIIPILRYLIGYTLWYTDVQTDMPTFVIRKVNRGTALKLDHKINSFITLLIVNTKVNIQIMEN